MLLTAIHALCKLLLSNALGFHFIKHTHCDILRIPKPLFVRSDQIFALFIFDTVVNLHIYGIYKLFIGFFYYFCEKYNDYGIL